MARLRRCEETKLRSDLVGFVDLDAVKAPEIRRYKQTIKRDNTSLGVRDRAVIGLCVRSG